MARVITPKCKQCRREGMKLFLKGDRCYSQKCAIFRRNQIPGQHGGKRKVRLSDYGKQLREKQKVKRIYGVLEKQFRKYYEKAVRQEGLTGFILLQILERRLDNLVYISGMASSRGQARQWIRQGKYTVNKKNVQSPSFLVEKDDIIGSSLNRELSRDIEDIPGWIRLDKSGGIKVSILPERDHISDEIEEQLIVEYYAR